MKTALLPATNEEATARYADMLAALGSEARLRIVRLLLSAHPEGLVVGEIGAELSIPPSTLSHHLDKLRTEGPSQCAARARSFATPPTPRRFRRSLGSFSPSAAHEQGDESEAITCACP